ncbi:MAG: response regulator transcription factor [Thioalkalispiraceae bacterium]|jgi:DNA-binding NarL/FixJ family response regulator
MRNTKNLQTIVILEKDSGSPLANLAASCFTQASLHQPTCTDTTHKLVKQHKPDLAIIDLDMVDGEIQEFIKSLKNSSPQTTCIVASYIEEDKEIFLALKAGAKGYLLKDKEEDQLLKHIVNIMDGQPTVAPSIAYQMLGYFHKQPDFDNQEALSERENQILKLIASGKKRALVASELNISMNTVASHLKAIYRKLNINSRAEATLEAVRRGLIKK